MSQVKQTAKLIFNAFWKLLLTMSTNSFHWHGAKFGLIEKRIVIIWSKIQG